MSPAPHPDHMTLPLPSSVSNPDTVLDLHPIEVNELHPPRVSLSSLRGTVMLLFIVTPLGMSPYDLPSAQEILVIYSECGNYVHLEQLSGTSSKAFIDAYTRGLQWFRGRAICPQFIRMDNQTSAEPHLRLPYPRGHVVVPIMLIHICGDHTRGDNTPLPIESAH